MSWGPKGQMPGSGGPWGQPRPSGSGGGAGKPPPPPGNNNDFEDLLRKGQDRFKGVFGADPDNKKAGVLMLALGALLWLASGVYIVQTDEQGVILRFGKYHRTDMPGLHYHLPWPIETAYTPSVTSVSKEQIGFGTGGFTGTSENEGLMLTGDLNIVDVNFEVQWKIDSGTTDHFLFNVREAHALVKPVAESAMREVIGQTPLETILTTGQTEIANRCMRIIQQVLNNYEAGIQITAVNLSKPDVPQEVIDAFQDVKRAEQQKNTLINQAEAYRNDIIPRARGRAVQIEQDALAYQQQVAEKAKGDVARFLSVYEEYKGAKDVTRKRMYLETMEEILGRMNKYIIDGKGSGGVVPYLPLNELKKPSSGAAQ